MSSGYYQYNPAIVQRTSEAPKWGAAEAPDKRNEWQRRNAFREAQRQVEDVQVPLPPGMEAPQRVARPANQMVPTIEDRIRSIIQRIRQQPTPAERPPAEAPPMAPPAPEPKSVLIR